MHIVLKLKYVKKKVDLQTKKIRKSGVKHVFTHFMGIVKGLQSYLSIKLYTIKDVFSL